MTDSRHGKSSASKLSLITKCPGFLQLWNSIKGKGYTEKEDTPDSSFGQAVHAAWAGNISELTLSERQQLVKQKADSIENKLRQEIFGDEVSRVFAETRFVLRDPKTGEIIHSAQIDKSHTRHGKWLLMDLKSLYSEQEPSDQNWQLLSQAVCIADDDDTRNANGQLEVQEIVACIVQPLVSLKPELVRYDIKDLFRAKRLILQKLDEAATPEAPRIPGPHCRYCPCSHDCPESAADLMAIEKRYNLGVSHLTPQMVANILPHMPSLKKRIRDFEAHAKQLAEENQLPGYEIRTQDGARYIQSQETVQSVRDALTNYISKEDILPLLSLPFGELREVFIAKCVSKDRCDKVVAGKIFDDLCEPHIKREKEKRLLVKSKEANT